MSGFVLKTLQNITNRYLNLDPHSKNRMRSLSGKVVKIIFPSGMIVCEFTEKGILLSPLIPDHTDLTIKTTPMTLLRFGLSKEKNTALFKEDIILEGDLDLGQEMADILKQMEIDWEEHLSQWIGDSSAYHLGKFSKKLKNFTRRLQDTFQDNVKEYIHEEIMLSPPAEMLRDFFDEVDELRMDVDRIEARINRLRAAKGDKQ